MGPLREGGAIDSASRDLVVLALCASAACTLKAPDDAAEPPPEVLSITVTPAEARLQPGQALAFHATVIGAGPVPQAVRWTATCLDCPPVCVGCGPLGAVPLDDGVFRPGESGRYRVTATSVVAPSVFASASVQAPAPFIAIAPTSADVLLGGEARFQVTLDGTVQAPAWSAQLGTVDASGRYRAPARAGSPSDVVRVRSDALGIEATAQIRLLIPPPVLSGTSGPAAPGDVLTVFGTGLDAGFSPGLGFSGTKVEVVFRDAIGGEVPAPPSTIPAGRLTVIVPAGAATGPLQVRLVTPERPTAVSNAVAFERNARLRVHAARAEIAAGETTRVDVTILGGAASLPLTFDADVGSVAGGLYTAPAAVATPTLATVRACLAGTSNCAGVTVTVRPFLVTPAPGVVPAGGSLSFSAQRGGAPIPATWAMGSGGGAVTPDGVFTAPTAPADGGASWILAADGGTAVPIQVGVTGLAPGLVARAERDAGVGGAALGASAHSVEIAGGRAYVSATSNHFLSPYPWLDIYDLADPLKPIWLGAVDMGAPAELTFAHGRLYAISSTYRPTAHRIEVFDLSGPLPALVASSSRRSTTSLFFAPPVLDADGLYEFGDPDWNAGTLPVAIHHLADGPLAPPRNVVLGPAPDAMLPEGDQWGRSATASGGRAWVSYLTTFRTWAIAVWDLAPDPPVFLGTTAAGVAPLSMRTVGPLLVTDSSCFDRRPTIPVPISCGDGTPITADGNRVVAWTGGELSIADFTDPLAVVKRGLVRGGATAGRLLGDVLYSPEGPGGLAVYDLGPDGGPRRTATADLAQPIFSLLASAVAGGFVYTAGEDGLGNAYLAAWDRAAAPPSLTSFTLAALPGLGLAVSGNLLVARARGELQVWSLADAAQPSLAGTLAIDGSAIAADGSLAFVGTRAGEIVVVDVSTPAAPSELGRVAPRPGVPVRAIVPLAPSRLAVAFGSLSGIREGDLAIIDVSVPGSPAVISVASVGEAVLDLAVGGGVAYLTTGDSLMIWSVADPAAPRPLATVSLPLFFPNDFGLGPERRVTLSDGLAWIVDSVLRAFDVRNPAWPRLVSEANVVSDAFVLDGVRGYDLSHPDPLSLDAARWTEVDLSRPGNVVLTFRPAPVAPPGATIPY